MGVKRAIGLMSGTSLDGIDVALIETDGRTITSLGPTGYRAYGDDERDVLRQAIVDAAQLSSRTERPGNLIEAEALITETHAEAVEAFLADHGLSRDSIDVVGFHGQTVLHRPEARITVQLGDGRALARRLKIPVVYDMRGADMDAGGQGAPMVPPFHGALAQYAGLELPVAILNLGGVANVTFIGADGSLLAFDTGPGNALIDDWMRDRTGHPLDDGGRTAARGRPDEPLLAWLLVHPFFQRLPPKSLDRNWFSHRMVGHLSVENGAATLTAFTARSVARALDFAHDTPQRWVVAGGGTKNGELLRLLSYHLRADMITADGLGWSAAFLEAQAFGFLAVRSLEGLALTFPTTTGVKEPTTGGVLASP
ncbi:anhydro-N-acetylmuramic acid kinase [Chelatococcus reniformis]|uniref:Anhydro-N-acetylmuramic acid kinase n=1 Tax=Chelatococcus reniformis TaxID=1494448 RepID=A0A916U1E1_9HYPH|nr:anhydro-N-acetylmuramic acid kinase [Chelatococcus reniformis]GGC56818.1 anhydro-N-acetylmuramic acid kinase [Chelatococcus reniformis]